jgi:hypothetical protein
MIPGLGGGVEYLDFYHQRARPVLSSTFDSEFWSRTTIQMACSEPAVRHALIALGYLYKTETGSLKNARLSFVGQQESGILIRHYNKAVRCLVDRINEASYTPEIGLVTCLLFVCIEYLRGNYHTAFTHLTNGLKILHEPRKLVRYDSPLSSPSEVSETSTSLSTTSTTSIHRSNVIEDELRPIFRRAMTAAFMYGVEVDASIDIPELSLQSCEALCLDSIREAQLLFHELRNQACIVIRDLSRKLILEQPFLAEDFTRQTHVLDCQLAWHRALATLMDTHKLSDADELVVSGMMTHYHTIRLWTANACTVSQMPLDSHLEEFQDILRHAKRILDAMDPNVTQTAARFTFEISIIPALYFVGQRCRCPTTRREAVALLARNPPREGMWDAEQHVLVLNRIIEMEEEEVDPETGWPVDRTRLLSSVIEARMDSNGGFWATFIPVPWAHQKTPDGQQRLLRQYFGV